MKDSKTNHASTPEDDSRVARRTPSWWSHAAYGFGVAALFVPFMIPGLPARALITIYFGVVTLGMLALMAWGVVHELRSARRARQRRRHRGHDHRPLS